VFGHIALLFMNLIVELVLAFVLGVLQVVFENNLFAVKQDTVNDIGKYIV